MRQLMRGFLALAAFALAADDACAQWYVGGSSYSWRVDKYDSFYGEARPTLWSVDRRPGQHWWHLLAHKKEIHRRMYQGSGGYPAIYQAAYSPYYYQGVPGGEPAYYPAGYPVGFPIDYWIGYSDAQTWRPSAIQVDPLPGDRKEAEPYPAEAAIQDSPPEPAPPTAEPAINGGAAHSRDYPMLVQPPRIRGASSPAGDIRTAGSQSGRGDANGRPQLRLMLPQQQTKGEPSVRVRE